MTSAILAWYLTSRRWESDLVHKSLSPEQNGDIFAYFLNENLRISIKISEYFIPKVQGVQVMSPGDKPLLESIMT